MGRSALPLSLTLRLPNIPVTRVENFCATGTEAFRGACYAVASGAYDICLALGVEKLKDTGYGGLPSFVGSDSGSLIWQWFPNMTAPGAFAQLASAYAATYKVPNADLKRAMAHVSAKSHTNAVSNPKAHLRKALSEDQVMAAPIIAHPLGLYDCCGVSDGAACAIVTTPEMAKKLGKKNIVTVKALQLALSSGEEMGYNDWDGDHFITTSKCSTKAYQEAGIASPKDAISMMEVHDCFSITELVTMEDLHLSERGKAWRDVMDGCSRFVAVCGNVLAALPFAATGRPFTAWVATGWEEDRRDRVRQFPASRRWLDRCVNGPVLRRKERQILNSGHILPLSEHTAPFDALVQVVDGR